MSQPIPDFLQHLPRHGALPVPFVTGRGADGRFDFRITHFKNHTLAQRFQLCGICGIWIPGPPYVFSVGPACLEARRVFEPAMHERCAVYAFSACPWMSRKNWQREEPELGEKQSVPFEEIPPKPERPALAYVPSYSPVQNPENKMWYADLPEGDFPLQWWHYEHDWLVPETQCPE
jgi:hypothetical protein